jgi:periplasmic protein TonB
MALRCLLFSSDERTAEPIRQVLAGLGVVGEHCSEAVTAVEKVTQQNYQIVIIDWDKQPEAGLLLSTARDRKAAERPLTLAIVSDDLSVPKALQAGANSTLRKPLQVNQVKDTLATARDLLRAKQESAASAAHAAAAGASAGSPATPPVSQGPEKEKPPRAGEFLQPSAKSHAPDFVSALEPVAPEKVSKPIAPIAAPVAPVASAGPKLSVTEPKPAPAPPAPASAPSPDKPRGLEWYLKTRAGAGSSVAEPVPAPPTPPPTPAKPELLGYDQPTTRSSPSVKPKSNDVRPSIPEPKPAQPSIQERKKEAELFAYMAAGRNDNSEEVPQPKSRLGKAAILGALALASCAILAAPQAPWHSQMLGLWARGRQAMHSWLNPQPVTPPQAPVAHENFGRAGDEYRLPASETIPDATTDPSQIQVLPVVDPTAKKPNNDTTNPEQPVGLPGVTGLTPSGATPNPGVQVQETRPAPSAGAPQPAGPTGVAVPTPASSTISPVSAPPHADSQPEVPPSVTSNVPPVPAQPAPPKNRQPHHAPVPGNVPPSLKSQLASMTPDASGNKSPETALPSIEPVSVPEAAERALLTDQPAIDYPPNAKGQATVVLQVLIGRDGAVQDAKFLQGSLAFARVAIDGVKQWKFKPYTMNGRAVSVQTLLTMSFKPTQ